MRNLRVTCITWNVGGPGCHSGAAAPLLARPAAVSDVIVVGLQEVALGRRGWKKALRSGLPPGWEYVGGQHYGGMRVKVFARTRLRNHLRLRTGMRVGVGVADRWPNKGAVAVELLYGKSCKMCFVVAHLAANESHNEDRHEDFVTILRRLDTLEVLTARTTDAVAPIPLFHRYDHVFFIGDLNYRLAPPGESHSERLRWVMSKIKHKDWGALSSVDQLLDERGKGKVFVNFEEAPISFAPTFKMEPGKNSYSKLRIPSYCDRVLCHSLPSRRPLVNCVKYESLPDFRMSDHRPVSALFEIKSPKIKAPSSGQGLRVSLELQLVRIHSTSRRDVDDLSSKENATQTTSSESPLEGRTQLAQLIESRPPFLPYSDSPGEEVYPENMQLRSLSLPVNKLSVMGHFDPDEEEDDEIDDLLDLGLEHIEMVDDEDSDADPSDPKPPENRQTPTNSPRLPPKGLESDDRDSGTSSEDPPPRRALIPRLRLRPGWTQRGDSRDPEAGNTGRTQPATSDAGSVGLTADVDVGPRKRDSLSREVSSMSGSGVSVGRDKRAFVRGLRMEVHGRGLFLKRERVYRIGIPKFDGGVRERIGDSLPVIPLQPVVNLSDLEHEHVLLVFGRSGARVGHSGVLPLDELVKQPNVPYAFDLDLTKYGAPGRRIEAVVQLVVSEDTLWVDSQRRVVRNADRTNAKHYRGPAEIRPRAKAKTVAAYSPRT